MNEIVTKCPAKINLNLRILDKREDGYHNIQTDYQLIDIYDHLNCMNLINASFAHSAHTLNTIQQERA